jgi:hypothetical protein
MPVHRSFELSLRRPITWKWAQRLNMLAKYLDHKMASILCAGKIHLAATRETAHCHPMSHNLLHATTSNRGHIGAIIAQDPIEGAPMSSSWILWGGQLSKKAVYSN